MPVTLTNKWNKYNDRAIDARFTEVTRSWQAGTVENLQAFDYFPDSFTAGQYIIFEQNMRFWGIRLTVGTPMVADEVTFVWEYYKNGSWVALNVINGDALTKPGQQDVLFSIPLNGWAGQSNRGLQVRVRIASVTNPTEGGAQAGDYIRWLERAYVGTGIVILDDYYIQEKADTYLIFTGTPSESLAFLLLPTSDMNSVTRIKITIADSAEIGAGDTIIFSGTDGFGNAITETVDVSAGNGTYYTQSSFQTLTSVSCSGFTDGTIQLWCARGCIVNKSGRFNYTFIGTFWLGDGVTTTSLTALNCNLEFMADTYFFIDSLATLTMGEKLTYNGLTVGSRGGSLFFYGAYVNNLGNIFCTRDSTSVFNFYGGQIGYYRGNYSTIIQFYNNPTLDWMDVVISASSPYVGLSFFGANAVFTRVVMANNVGPAVVNKNPVMIDCIVGCTWAHYHLWGTILQGGKFAHLLLQASGDAQRLTTKNIDVTNTALNWQYTDYYNCSEGFRILQTLDLTVIDEAWLPISEASVLIKDVFGNIVATAITNEAGQIPSQELKQKTQDEVNGIIQPWVMHTPHSVTISKSGYKTRTIQYVMDKPRNEIEMLELEILPPISPSGLNATTISQTAIDLNWTDNSDNETGFRIERSPNGETLWTHIATVNANVTTYQDGALACGTTYYYRVCAVNDNGLSGYSNVAQATTNACTVPIVLVELKSMIP